MLAVTGTYQNGMLELYKEYIAENPVRVIATFLEDTMEQKHVEND